MLRLHARKVESKSITKCPSETFWQILILQRQIHFKFEAAYCV